ncbi:hypothetical protein ABET51_18490 [Metabacillus fastidiosus]|uniref:hypothetical protein n=1 Tax=Metabacillus fastidiosus TaxID=1458 RepID=UPI003D2710BA
MESEMKWNIYDIFAFYQKEDFYYKFIPQKITNLIINKFDIPAEETVIAFMNFRFNSGICFTEKGMYWKIWGQGKGKYLWRNLDGILCIKVEKTSLYLDTIKILDLSGTLYPPDQFVLLLEDIKKNSLTNGDFYSSEITSLVKSIQIEDIVKVCTNFKGNDNCWVCKVLNINVKTEDAITEKMRRALITENNIQRDDTLIAYINTYMGIGTDGIVITEEGIFFSEKFLSLYYPWHLFKQIKFIFKEDTKELLINNSHMMNLSCSITKGEDILLFLQQLQRQKKENFKI